MRCRFLWECGPGRPDRVPPARQLAGVREGRARLAETVVSGANIEPLSLVSNSSRGAFADHWKIARFEAEIKFLVGWRGDVYRDFRTLYLRSAVLAADTEQDERAFAQ